MSQLFNVTNMTATTEQWHYKVAVAYAPVGQPLEDRWTINRWKRGNAIIPPLGETLTNTGWVSLLTASSSGDAQQFPKFLTEQELYEVVE